MGTSTVPAQVKPRPWGREKQNPGMWSTRRRISGGWSGCRSGGYRGEAMGRQGGAGVRVRL